MLVRRLYRMLVLGRMEVPMYPQKVVMMMWEKVMRGWLCW